MEHKRFRPFYFTGLSYLVHCRLCSGLVRGRRGRRRLSLRPVDLWAGCPSHRRAAPGDGGAGDLHLPTRCIRVRALSITCLSPLKSDTRRVRDPSASFLPAAPPSLGRFRTACRCLCAPHLVHSDLCGRPAELAPCGAGEQKESGREPPAGNRAFPPRGRGPGGGWRSALLSAQRAGPRRSLWAAPPLPSPLHRLSRDARGESGGSRGPPSGAACSPQPRVT